MIKKLNLNGINDASGGMIIEVMSSPRESTDSSCQQEPRKNFMISDNPYSFEIGSYVKPGTIRHKNLSFEDALFYDRALHGKALIRTASGKLLTLDGYLNHLLETGRQQGRQGL